MPPWEKYQSAASTTEIVDGPWSKYGVGGDGDIPKETATASPLAEVAVSVVEPGHQKVPGKSFLQKLGAATKETFLPSMEGIKRLFSPQVGQFGLSRLAQEQGEKVQDAVSSVSPLAGGILPPLTPRSAAENLGAEAVAPALVAPAARAVSKAAAPFQELLTGIPGKEWLKLSKNLKSLRPKWLGGAPSKTAAGEAITQAENAAGLFESSLPSGLGKEYADKQIAVLSQLGTPEQLAKPEFVNDAVQALTPQEALTLREAVKNTLDQWVAGKNGKEYRRYAILKDALNGYMEKISPAIREAQAVFADAAQRDKFMSLLPRSKYGQPSIGRLGFTGAATGGAALSAWGDPEEMAERAATVLAVSAPASHAVARTAATLGTRAAPRGLTQILRAYNEKQKQGKKKK